MNMVSLPRLLDGNMAAKAVLHPTSLSITFNLLNAHTAQMRLTKDDAGLAIHDIVELFTIKGSAGLYRVTNISHTLRGDVDVTLRHVIDTLIDGVWPDDQDYDGTVPDYLAKLIGYQPRKWWQLGTCEDTADFAKTAIDYTQLSDMLTSMLDDRGAFYPTYDLSTTPWTLNIKAFPTTIKGEFRLRRNINSCRITRDDSDLCNRVYVSWESDSDAAPDEYNNTASQAIYGVVAKAVTLIDQTVKDKTAWVNWYFGQYATPGLKISIDGQELQKLTGEAWDEYSVGSIVRVALPEYGETYQERCVSVNYPDVLGQPYNVTVQLANRQEKFSGAISTLQKKVSGGGGGGGSTGSDSVSKSSSGARKASAANKNELQGIHSVVYGDGTGENAGLVTIVDQNSESISLIASRVTTTESDISDMSDDIDDLDGRVTVNTASITVNADAITAEVTRATDAETTLGSRITQTAESITAEVNGKVSKSSISITEDSITVDSTTFTVNATTIVSKLASENLTVVGLTAGTTSVTALSCTSLTVGSTGFSEHSIGITAVGFTGVLATGDLNLNHSHGITFSESGGTVTATIGDAQAGGGSDSFDIASTQFYVDAVEASRKSGWDSGLKSATVSIGSWADNNGTYSLPVYATGKLSNGTTWTSSANYATLPNLNVSGSLDSGTDSTYTVNVNAGNKVVATGTLYATAAYKNGEKAGKASVTLSQGNWNQNDMLLVSATNGQVEYVELPSINMFSYNWYNGTKQVYCRRSGGTTTLETYDVDIPTPSISAKSVTGTTYGLDVKVTVRAGGATWIEYCTI